MAEETFATLRELDDVKQDFRDLRNTVASMDANGTRGVVGLQASMTDLIRDLLELKTTFQTWISNHERLHKEDLAVLERRRDEEIREKKEEALAKAKERRETRRWIVFMALTAIGSFGGLYAIILTTH
jgi:hypothetical protein